MTYVCSDIHGCYDKYLTLLDEIEITNSNNHLYVLGDVVDREGNGGIDILQNILDSSNVTLILGNHEEIALEGFELLMSPQVKNASDLGDLPEYVKVELTEWINLGGIPTIEAFRELPRHEQNRIVRFLSNRCLTYAELAVDGTDYVLCHHDTYYDYDDVYDAVLVTGHVPTRFIDDCPKPDYIWRDGNHWHIDCGCGYGGQLGAVCLETGEEFYF